MASTIGIKIANGEFYSILNENSTAKKRLILTTVHNNQNSVQIDLYKSDSKTMADALYIGSLVVEKIKLRPKGTPSIELIISSGKDGTIKADALDMDTTNSSGHQYLSVSMQTLEEDTRDYDIPDFEMEDDDLPPPVGLYEKANTVKKNHEHRSRLPLIIILILLLLAVLAGVWYFFLRDTFPLDQIIPAFARQTQSAPVETVVQAQPPQQAAEPAVQQPTASPEPAAQPEPQVPPEPVTQAEPQVVEPVPVAEPSPAPAQAAPPVAAVQTPATPAATTPARTKPPAPVASYNVPATIPREGAPYRIRYGDTLWDIAAAFYKNPWLYPRIASFNNIRNPDRIISGTTIRVPPKN